MREELVLNVEQIANGPEDYDALREAVNRLTAASENQFEEIKKEKWYNRVFDMITFSKKNEKRLAEQISTLAQAQQILVELLLRLAQNDANISQLVLENTDSIRRLSENDIYLLERIKKLEERAQGIHDDTDFRMLSEKAKKVLCALLYKLSERKSSNEAQTAFANAILSYLGENDVQMDSPFAALADFEDTKTRKAMLACCMEYIYLGTCTDDAYDEYQDFIDEFDFGRKTVESIKAQISKICAFRGAEGLYQKYVTEEEEKISDSFYVEMEDVSEEDIINGCEWYPVFEKVRFKYEVYLALKADPEVRKVITKEAISVKTHGNFIYYLIGEKYHEVHLCGYDLANKQELVFNNQLDESSYDCEIIDCTNDWIVCITSSSAYKSNKIVVVNLHNGKVGNIHYGDDDYSALQKIGGVIVGDYFYRPFSTHRNETVIRSRFSSKEKTFYEHYLYKINLNSLEISKIESINKLEDSDWAGKMSKDGKYVIGFWYDGHSGNYQCMKFDTEANRVEDIFIIKNEDFYSSGAAIYHKGKYYFTGEFPTFYVACVDITNHTVSKIEDFGKIDLYSDQKIRADFSDENGRLKYEIMIPAKRHTSEKDRHIVKYIN